MNKFDFSRRFQKDLLALIIRSPEVAFAYRTVIEPHYFESQALKTICATTFKYIDKFGNLPKRAALEDKIMRDMQKFVGDKKLEQKTVKIFNALYDRNIHDREYVFELARSFAESQAWKNALLEGLEYIDNGDFDSMFDLCLKARDKGNLTFPYVVTRELKQRLSRLTETVEGGIIKVGIKHMDEKIRFYRPQYNGLIGPSGIGKSWFLINGARHGVRQGYDGLYFTGEMTPDELATRFDASMLGIDFNLFYEPSLHKNLKKRIKEKYSEFTGKLTIISFPSGQYSVQELEADVRRFCMSDTPPSFICVDYMDLLSYKDSGRRGMNTTETQLAVSRYLRGIAYKHKLLVWALGTQLTKGTDKEQIATRNNKSGAGDISYDFDNYFTLNQNDDEEAEGIIKIYHDKSRTQKCGWLFKVQTDYSRSRFCTKSLGVAKKKSKKGSKKDE